MKTTYTHQAVCSVCFLNHFLNPARSGLNPIRHGFHVIGGHGQGHEGSWHTGPCAGVGFPHFGHSTEGTIWALGQIKNAIDGVVKLIQCLNAKPALNWSYTPRKYDRSVHKYVPDTDNTVTRVLTVGTESIVATFRQDGITSDQTVKVPSYDQELATRLNEAQRHLDNLTNDRLRYETAIATWKPAAPVKAAGKVVMVHKVVALTKGPRPRCNRMMSSFKVAGIQMTEDDSKVTCQRCKR